jgi:predicted ATPase/transcriptional regulator with XRE-family HTH domain
LGKELFGELLAGHRCAARLTQEELAARAGLSVDAIGVLERGLRTAPRRSTVVLLAAALGLSPDDSEAFAAAARRRGAGPGGELQVPPDLRMRSTTFVGRARDMARVHGLLGRADVRLLTLIGPPGAGKTRLALESAGELVDEYRDGVTVVSLGALDRPGLVLPAIRQALGLREARGEAALQTVAAYCRTRSVLLVLDNFEHVRGATPDLVELLGECPRLRLLVTSRAALRVRPEHELWVPPLDEAASVALFVERADAAAPGFRQAREHGDDVAAICRRLEGLPLALELAAPWVRLLNPAQLRERLDHRLDLLVAGSRDLPERQRTLRGTLTWSCELLEPPQLALLRRLSVFAGGAPLEALEPVCQAAGALPGGVLPHLAVLVDHSLVRRHDAADGEPRVTLLESVREYGREVLAAAGELETTALAHLEHYAALAESSRDQLRGNDQEAWLDRLRREHGNVRAALGWAETHGHAETGLRLASAIWLFWDYGGHRHEGLDWIGRLLAAAGDAEPALRARALHAAGRLAEGDPGGSSVTWLRESLRIYRELGNLRGAVEALRGLALAVGVHGDHARAMSLLEEAAAILGELDDPSLLASVLMNLGVEAMHHGDPARATALYEEALALRRRAGDLLGVALCLVNLAGRAREAGDLDRAGAYLDEAEAVARRVGSPYHLAAALANLGDLARTRGDRAGAGARYGEGLRLFAGLGERSGAAVCLRGLGWAAWHGGRLVDAARLYGAAEAMCPVAIAPDSSEQALHEHVCSALRARLGAERYAAAHRAGGRISLEEAAELAPPRSFGAGRAAAAADGG